MISSDIYVVIKRCIIYGIIFFADLTDNLSKSVNRRKEIERIQKTNKILKANIIVHSEEVVLSFENQELSKLLGICKSIGNTGTYWKL